MDWRDQAGATTLKQLVERSAERELGEEWFKKRRDWPLLSVQQMAHIGYFRMPHRGGKPEFAVLAKLNNSSDDLRPASDVEAPMDKQDTLARFEVPRLEELQKACSSARYKVGRHQHSVPLLGALICLERAIRDNPGLVAKILGYPEPA